MAQVKHYVGYDTDGSDVVIGSQALHEIYLAPFSAVVNAGVSFIMCSYNKINGEHSCGNRYLLTKVLRDELGLGEYPVESGAIAIAKRLPTARAGNATHARTK